MTFSRQVKDEIFDRKPLSGKERGFFSYGLLLCSSAFTEEVLELNTESTAVSKLYCYSIGDILGHKVKPVEKKSLRGEPCYTLQITDREEIEKLQQAFEGYLPQLLEEDKGRAAFLTGAFMACGTISDPQKEYRLELHPPTDEISDLLFLILSQMGYPPKTTERGNKWSLYFKESEQIEDLLNIFGATTCGFQIMEMKIYKEVRNKSNRLSNCDNANIDKIVDAAQQQLGDIQYIFGQKKENLLTPPLKEMAILRMENPDASLRELSEMMGISRSGVNHRLKKLSEIAGMLRLEQ